jgi:hypothetical protein
MTAIEPMTESQAQALANVLAEMRPGDWKQAQLLKLFWEHRDKHPFPHLALAAVRVADNPAIKSPAVIFMPGAHWDMSEIKTPKPRPEPCPQHIGEQAHNCRCCAADRKAEQPQTTEAAPEEAASLIQGDK